MTLERASELVSELTGDAKCDLFMHFVDFFSLSTESQLENFAVLCGFVVARNVTAVF